MRNGNYWYKKSRTFGSLYVTWDCMKQRCYNPNRAKYYLYGGKGVTICEEWLNFKKFMDWSIHNHWHKGLTIDRIDSNGNYEPSNCRWITREENGRRARLGWRKAA